MQDNAFNMTGFLIQGFSDIPELRLAIFFLFLLIYFIIIGGNVTIISVIWANPHLLMPMYLFLINLALMDMASTTAIVPKLLDVHLTTQNNISLAGCITQLYFFFSVACSETILLAAMAYDRYVAICYPLHYSIFMTLKNCIGLSLSSWTIGFLDVSGHAILISRMSFCRSHLIGHFFCDMTPLLMLSCSDMSIIDLLNYIEGTVLTIFTFVFTITSYIFIISTILKIKSSEGRLKAFSTCSAHLTCVTLFYGTIISLYIRPSSSYAPKFNKFASLLYVVLVPLLNPIIYTLKNEDVKKALRHKINLV